MKNNKHFFVILLLAIVLFCLSCASVKDAAGVTETKSLLPMSTGWYQYDSERTLKGIEDEYNFELNYGMKMVQEITMKYTGVVCRFEDGVLYDPVSAVELTIDRAGKISCVENISIRGTLEKNGSFFWSGLQEEHGRLNSIFVKGAITPLPSSVRGGPEFDGVYHLSDPGTGREMLARIAGGFYTWRYLDEEEAGFTPWPTLIHPDGSFSSGLEMTTVMAMGEITSMNFSNIVIIEGNVVPGQGITMDQITRSVGLGNDQGGAPQTYAGTTIRSGEYSNEAIPRDVESLVKSGRAAVKAEPKPNRQKYPSWYLNIPSRPGLLYAAGEKTFDDKEVAFAMAEAAAAANLAEQIRVRIESSFTETSTGSETNIEEQIRSEALQRLDYRVSERLYNDETHTAFVLAEMVWRD